MDAPLRLGGFELLDRIAEGAFSSVWRARHAGLGLLAAIKVVAGGQSARAAFAREVRAVARLDHPGILVLFDQGVVPADAAAASGGRLDEGSPYLAMELADGSLADRPASELRWPRVRSVLHELLDALAHAHARGVVHRDVKPHNLLVFGSRLKLADFGLAHALAADDERQGGGTPRYMAPEQILGRWRDFGPWTDLYAVGCTAWELVVGRPLFQGGWDAVRRAHLGEEPPPLRPVIAVPDGLEEWLGTLLGKTPASRYACAADAAHDLAALGEAHDGPRVPVSRGPIPVASTFLLDDPEERPGGPPTAELPRASFRPVPADWRRDDAGIGRVRLPSLALQGLREPALVDREAERELLWQELQLAAGGVVRAVVLRGPAGAGKSRLAAWVAERAHEVGAAHVVRGVYGDPPGPRDGLAAMVEARLRCQGLARREVAARIAAAHDEDVAELTELVRPRPRGEADALAIVDLGRPEARIAVVARFLRRLSVDRPVIVWLEDVQWGPEAVALAEQLVGQDSRLLVVLTARAGVASPALDALLRRPTVREIRVGPLGAADHALLVGELLGVPGQLAAELLARAGGVPVFAVQLVSDWIERGLLEPASDGLRPRAGADLGVPDALHALWMQRVERALAGRPAADRAALEVAAVLGGRVDTDEWVEACAVAGLPAPTDLVERLEDLNLVVPDDAGIAFTHAMLVESVVRMASDAGRIDGHRAAVCDALRQAGQRAVVSGRVQEGARLHERGWRIAGTDTARRAQAASLLGDAYRQLGRVYDARELLESAVATLAALGDDPLLGGALGRLALLDREQGRTEEAVAATIRALESHRRAGDRVAEAEALNLLATAAWERSDVARATALYHEVLALGAAIGDARTQSSALTNLAGIAHDTGRTEEALDLYRRSVELARGTEDRRGHAIAQSNLAQLLGSLGRREEARAVFREAIETARSLGDLRFEGFVLGALAEVDAGDGREADARSGYERALELHRAVANRRFEAYTLGRLAALASGAEKRALREQELALFVALGDRWRAARARIGLAGCLASEGARTEARRHLEEALASARAVGDPEGEALATRLLAELATGPGGP